MQCATSAWGSNSQSPTHVLLHACLADVRYESSLCTSCSAVAKYAHSTALSSTQQGVRTPIRNQQKAHRGGGDSRKYHIFIVKIFRIFRRNNMEHALANKWHARLAACRPACLLACLRLRSPLLAVPGVTIYFSDFKRSLVDKLQKVRR